MISLPRHVTTTTFDRRCVELVLTAAVLLGAAGQAHGKRVLFLEFGGSGGPAARQALAAEVMSEHTVISPDQIRALAGLSGAACVEGTVADLARFFGADAVICGDVKGRRRRKTLAVAIRGGDGALIQKLSMKLRRGTLAAGAAAGLSPALARSSGTRAAPGWRMGTRVAGSADAQVRPLLQQLSSQVPAYRLSALNELARISQWQIMMPFACTLLQDESLRVRRGAAAKMASMHDLAVVTAQRVSTALEPDSGLRQTITGNLGGLRNQLRQLIPQLSDPAVARRMAAARALGSSAHSSSLQPLITALGDRDARVRLLVVEGLRNFPQSAASAALKKASRDTHATVRKVATRLVKERRRLSAWRAFHMSFMRISKKARSTQATWRVEAAVALGINGAESAIPLLSRLLTSDPRPQVRLAAAWSLATMSSNAARSALQRATSADSSAEVKAAARAFQQASQASQADIQRNLSSPRNVLRRRAAEVLAVRADAQSTNHLLRLSLCDPSPRVREATLRGLARIGTPLALTGIRLAMYRDTDVNIRRAAMMMYVLVGWSDDAEPVSGASSEETAAWVVKDGENPLKNLPAVKKSAAVKPRKAEPPADRCPVGCKALNLRVGPSMLFLRDFGVDSPTNSLDGVGMTSTPVAGFNVGVTFYPATWWTKGWLSSFGVGFHYDRHFGLAWHPDNDTDASHDITHQSFTVDILRFRYQPVRDASLPTLSARIGVRHHEFLMNDAAESEAHIPDMSVTSAVLGLGARIPIMSIALHVGVDFMPEPSWGEVTENDEYGEGSGWGVMARAGLGGSITEMIGWRAVLTYTRYMVEFEAYTARRKAAAAADQYFNGMFFMTMGL